MQLLDLLKKFDLDGVAITAAIEPDGTLKPVGSIYSKLIASLRETRLPRVRIAVVPDDSPRDPSRPKSETEKPKIIVDEKEDFCIIQAQGIIPAIEQIDQIRRSRWGIPDCDLPARNPDFVGRKELKQKLQEFIAATQSGYLVIVGGMGKGKSTFLTEFLNDEKEAGRQPVYHIIAGSETSLTAQPENIAQCFYIRLRRKYPGFEEPDFWSKSPVPPSWAHKLECILRHVGNVVQQYNLNQEVLYLDAADQANLGDNAQFKPLLPGTFQKLPAGVLCVITSRIRLEWLGSMQNVTQWDFNKCTNDHADIAQYINLKNTGFDTPLPLTLVEAVVQNPVPPVFFTVNYNFVKIANPSTSASERNNILSDLQEWLKPPEVLVQDELAKAEELAQEKGITSKDFWRTLAIPALVPENLSEEDMLQLGLWKEGTSDTCFKLAANFFKARFGLRNLADIPYEFSHPGYAREILSYLTSVDREMVHAAFAKGCEKWEQLSERARRYALKHRITHLAEAHLWKEIEETFGDVGFVVEKAKMHGEERQRRSDFSAVHAELVAAIGNCPADLLKKSKRLTSLESFLRFRIERLNTHPEMFAQELLNEGPEEDVREISRRWIINYMHIKNKVWLSKERGPAISYISHHNIAISDLAFSPNGLRIASGHYDATIKIWDVNSGAFVADCFGHTGAATCVAFSHDSSRVISGSKDCTVKIWNTTLGTLIAECIGHTDYITSVAYSPEGLYFASGSRDKTIKIWNAASVKIIANCHANSNSDSNLALSNGVPSKIEIEAFNVIKGRAEIGINDVTSIAFCPDASRLASGHGDASVKLWNVSNGKLIKNCIAHKKAILKVAFSLNGSSIFSVSEDGIIKIWNSYSGDLIRDIFLENPLSCVAFSPDYSRLACVPYETFGWEGCEVREILSGSLITRNYQEFPPNCLAFSPDGSKIATSHFFGGIHIWDAASGKRIFGNTELLKSALIKSSFFSRWIAPCS